MEKKPNLSRREICRNAALTIPAGLALLVAGRVVAGPAPAPGGLKLVAETDPTAKALKYVKDATTAKREKKGAVEGKDQFCDNCQMYTKQGAVEGQEAGKCLMIQGGSVTAKGWCASWIKKA